MINKALRGENLIIYGTGEYIRDYIYIDDVISTFLSATIYINKLNGKHFVLGSGKGKTINDAIHLVGELVTQKIGKKIFVKNIDMPEGMSKIEFRSFEAGIDALRKIGLCNNMLNIDVGIKKTIEYYKRK